MSGVRCLVAALMTAVSAAAAPADGQTVQYRSPAGVEYRSQISTGAIARAESALVADPRNIDRIIQLGIAQSGATDWLWMSLMRAGRGADAQAMLARRPDSLPATTAYARRLKLYRGEIGPRRTSAPSREAPYRATKPKVSHTARGEKRRSVMARIKTCGGLIV